MRRLVTSLAAGVVMTLAAANASAQTPFNRFNDCNDPCQQYNAGRDCRANLKPDGHIIKGACKATCHAYKWTMDCLFTGPYPSHAPYLIAPGNLAFPTHPYVRSPRDFFMTE
jgi:hypothetical protein